MRFNKDGEVLCEKCEQPNGRLHVVGPTAAGLNEEGDVDYWLVCYRCVSDIGSWADPAWQRAIDNQKRLLWTRSGGQLFVSDGSSENAPH